MTGPIELEVISSKKVILQKTAIKELYIPAFHGEAGILENHLPYITLLQMGEVSYLDPRGKRHYFYVEDGFVESGDNKIVIVSDTVEPGEEINEEQVNADLRAVTDLIKSASKIGEVTPDELNRALIEEKQLKIKAHIVQQRKE